MEAVWESKGDFKTIIGKFPRSFASENNQAVEKLKDQHPPNFRIRKSYPQKSKTIKFKFGTHLTVEILSSF